MTTVTMMWIWRRKVAALLLVVAAACSLLSLQPAACLKSPPPTTTTSYTVLPSNALLTWQKVLEDQCGGTAAEDCDVTIAAGEVLELNGDDAQAASVIVEGELTWGDNSNEPSTLTSGVLVAQNGGQIYMGVSSENPAPEGSRIYLKDNGRSHNTLGKRVFGALDTGASIRLYGRPMQRTWMLLIETALSGDLSITLDGDASEAGWRVGDQIAIAPTSSFPRSDNLQSSSEEFTIAALDGNTVTLDSAISQPRLGSAARRMQAEVINLSRTVLVTGDDYDANEHGLHTIAAFGAVAKMSYARIEKGGQRGNLGRYPIHLHHAKDCPECSVVGMVVHGSSQRGLVVHGTHRSLIDQNILYGVKGAGIYVEDGNEMFNTFSSNVNLCPSKGYCQQTGTDNPQSDLLQQSGFWSMSNTNDFIGNRMINHWNGFSTQTSAFPTGRGPSTGRLCPMHAPYGKIEGNVCHSNENFGLNLDRNYPRKIDRSIESNGRLSEKDFSAFVDGNLNTESSCDEFTASGEDNGVPATVVDQLEFGNQFSGSQALGDVQFDGFHAINNFNGLVWTETKNMQVPTRGPHIRNSVFEWIDSDDDSEIRSILGSSEAGRVAIAGPGGLGSFGIDSVAFIGPVGDAIAANNDCGNAGAGALCTPEYQLHDLDFSKFTGDSKRRVRFGISGGNTVLPIFLTSDDSDNGSLRGHSAVASSEQTHLLGLAECSKSNDNGLDNGIACSSALRRLQIWSGVQKPGGAVLVSPSGERWQMPFISAPADNSMKQGYGAAVAPGNRYTVELDRDDGIVIEFSDVLYDDEIELDLVFRNESSADRTCAVSSKHSRLFIGPNGPQEGRSGLGACTSPPPV
jgi:hypothetical protein